MQQQHYSGDFLLVTHSASFRARGVLIPLASFAKDIAILERHGRHVNMGGITVDEGAKVVREPHPAGVRSDVEFVRTLGHWERVADGGPDVVGCEDEE